MYAKERKVIGAGEESTAAPLDSVPAHTSPSSIEKETMQYKRRKVIGAGKESRAAPQDSVPTHTSSSSIEKETMQYKRRKVNSAGKESTAAPAPQDLVPAHASSSSIDKETMYYKRRKAISAGEITTAAPVLDTVPAHTSSSSTNGRRYEVFLSFRGVDTRTNFTDHLYTALDDAGINTFRDDDEIRMGHELSSELLTAIQQSRISIPVFSRNYADSKWCLIELAKIVECKEKMDQIVLPIFYDVEPSDVRNQKGTYAEAFSEHQKRFEKKMVDQWKEALRVVGSLKGENAKNWHEAKLIKSIVTMVLSELKNTSLVNTNYLVGIQYHVNEMLKLLDVSSTEVRIVGIHGMGGIGKTTIAKAIYNKISCYFENCSFLEDVRETYQQHKGVQLQKQLISNILKRKDVDITSVDEGVHMIKQRFCRNKVLIVLDDVDNLDQLRALANERNWFGLGSRIIITTRDKHILNEPKVDETYEPSELDSNQSLKLFSMHAFRRDRPLDEYYDLSSAIANTAGGLPLALEVLGSHLFGKHKAMWEDTLKKLEKIPHDQVQKKLRISYDGLDYVQKQIFLDIACFFIGMDKRIAAYIWDDCDYFPQEGINTLLHRSLVKISYKDELRMHSQLRDLGREIVNGENFKEPGERSRLWLHDEALEVLMTRTGTRKVEGLCLDFGNGSEVNCLRNKDFAEMSKLRLLKIDYAVIGGDYRNLLSKLRWLSWKGCPYNFTPTNFHPEKLIVLDLSWSKVTEDWAGWNQIKMANKLKVISLLGCYDLIRTPNFSAFPSLERLILEDCSSLVEIDASVGYLKYLVFLNVKGCIKLGRLSMRLGSWKALRELHIDETSIGQLSDSIALPEKLEILSARNCPFFTVLPTSIGHLRFLTNLALDETKIVVLPDSIGSLLKLQHLSLCHCKSLRRIPDSIGQLESLVGIYLLNAGVTEIPDSIGHLKSLIYFNLSFTQIVVLPDSIGSLLKLQCLSLRHCKSLRRIPDSIGQLESLVWIDLRNLGVTEIPDSIGHLKSLTDVKFDGTQIVVLPDSIGSLLKLQRLSLCGCQSLRRIPDSIGQLQSLVEIDLHATRVTKIPDSFGHLKSLKDVTLSDTLINGLPDSVELLFTLEKLLLCSCRLVRRIPDSIFKLDSLLKLDLSDSTRIIEIPDAIGELKSLTHLELGSTEIVEVPDSIGLLSMLQILSLKGCGSLRSIPDSIGRLESLRKLNLEMTGIIEIPDAIGELKSLTHLELGFTEIVEVPDSIGLLSMLLELSLKECGSLRRIPDSIRRLESLRVLNLKKTGIVDIPDAISELKSLTHLDLGFTQIIELPESIGLLSMLRVLSLEGCGSLRSIPDSIGKLESLRELNLVRTRISEIPDTIGHLNSLVDLQLNGTQITELPDSIWSLSKLKHLSLIHCGLSQKFPDSIWRLESLEELKLDTTGIMDIPNGIWNLMNLKNLSINDETTTIGWYIGRREIPSDTGKLSSLRRLLLWSENSFSLPKSISSLRLDVLRIKNCRNYPSLPDLPSTLYSLHVSGCVMETLPNLSNLTNLKILEVGDCENLLQCFPHLPSGLGELCLSNLESLPDLSNLKRLQKLKLTDFFKQTEIQGLERMKGLTSLDLSGCRSIERLPDLSIMRHLSTLILRNCEKLCDVEGLDKLESLRDLDMSGCISLERLPFLSNLKLLKELRISDCKKLLKIQGINELKWLERLYVNGCISMERLPDVPEGLLVFEH